MSRNPDGTFKTGDAETRESARKGGTASGGSRAQAQHGQRHAKPSQQSQSSPGHDSPPGGNSASERGGKRDDQMHLRDDNDRDDTSQSDDDVDE